jgi:hypothetical protein
VPFVKAYVRRVAPRPPPRPTSGSLPRMDQPPEGRSRARASLATRLSRLSRARRVPSALGGRCSGWTPRARAIHSDASRARLASEISARTWRKREDARAEDARVRDFGSARSSREPAFVFGEVRLGREGDCPYERHRKKWPFRFPEKSSRNARRQLSTRNERGTRACAFALHVARIADDRHRHAHARIGRGAPRESHRLRSKRCGTRTRVAFDASIA